MQPAVNIMVVARAIGRMWERRLRGMRAMVLAVVLVVVVVVVVVVSEEGACGRSSTSCIVSRCCYSWRSDGR